MEFLRYIKIFFGKGLSRSVEETNREMARLGEELSQSQMQNVTAMSSVAEINNRGSAVADASQTKEAQLEEYLQEQLALQQDLKNIEERFAECDNMLKGNQMLLTSLEKTAAEKKQKADELSMEAQTILRRLRNGDIG